MATAIFDPERVVDEYFDLIRELRKGQESAVAKLLDLWDEDGVFEFGGAPPVTGTFKGKNAIHALYKNRAKATGMPLELEGDSQSRASTLGVARQVALGTVDTNVKRKKTLGIRAGMNPDRVAVSWTTVIGTADNRGFEVSGNHSFIFKEGKIASLKVIVSPKPDDSTGLSLRGLSVDDIGRLSLAAWAVV
ncbi:MAG: hypothetical protein KDJ22_00375 [Candidatus Competibacteraceae bacterium]|nr:hypothetical protein [Candidatus Competibacteraceae bacterium]